MDFHLTREQELVRQMMHDFTENEVKPIAAETDKSSTYPREYIEKLAHDIAAMRRFQGHHYRGASAGLNALRHRPRHLLRALPHGVVHHYHLACRLLGGPPAV